MIRPYAVVPADWNPRASDDQTVELSVLRGEDVAVVYGELEQAPDRTPDQIIAFGRTLTAMAASGPMLPIRYGTVAADLDLLRQMMQDRTEEWRRRLVAVAGHVEMIVHMDRAAQSATTHMPPANGREYLMAKVRAHSWGHDRYDEVLDAVGDHVHDVRRLGSSDEHLRIALLVPESELERFQEAVGRLSQRRGSYPTQITGPW
ncbi:MAG TPA: GvpL/GvpF family gas vesicle protein, partial [Microlunatus sp.]